MYGHSSYLKGSQHAARNQYKEPEVHVEELGDFKSHEHWENQQKQTHAEAAEVFPHTPGSTDVKNNFLKLLAQSASLASNHCCRCYLLRDAPRARMMGSVISIMDCKVEVTTMKRMILRRKVRCSACISNRPVWRASRRRVTPSVTPLRTRKVKVRS